MNIYRLPLHALCVHPHPAGPLNGDHLAGLLDGTREDTRPLEVLPVVGGRYTILRGRHRYIAALIRGDGDVACILKTERVP